MADLAGGTSTWSAGTADTHTAAGNGVGVTEVTAERVNGPASAILGLQTILGAALTLKGSLANLSTRLAVLLAASGGINGGTVFPTSPTPIDAQLFWRTDLKQLHIYDGALAQWQRIDGVNDHGNLGGLADNDHAWAARFASGVTNVNAQLTHANAAVRTYTLPDLTDTIALLTAIQTLTNKTLTAPTIADLTNATHNHSNAAGGGATLTSPTISAPVLSGTATGTYTLGGTPTITAPTISAPVLSGTATGTGILGGSIVVPLARMQVDESFVSNAASVTVTSGFTVIVDAASITVAVGDRILIGWQANAAKGVTAGVTRMHAEKSSGTATVLFYNNAGSQALYGAIYRENLTAASASVMGSGFVIGRATVAGTIVISLLGLSSGSNSTVAIGEGQIHVLALRGT